MENNNKSDTIHRFLLDDMDAKEKAEFENEMASSEVIKNKVEMEKRFLNTIDMAADVDLKKTISSVHSDLKREGFFENQQTGGAKIINMNERRSSHMLMAIAAVAAILIASWFIFNNTGVTSIDTDAVFADNYKPENKIIEIYLLPSAGTIEGNFRIALDQYDRGEYKMAKDLLAPLQNERPINDAVTFYLALSDLGLNNISNTILLLEPLSKKESELQAASMWYLGLAYLKNKEQKKAQAIFESLAKSTDEEYRAKATLLLKELK